MRKNEIQKDTIDILATLNSNLPPGWKLTEGSVRVEQKKYHSWLHREDQKKISNKHWSIELVLDEFAEMDQRLPPGWKLRWGTVESKDEEFVIKRNNGRHGTYYVRRYRRKQDGGSRRNCRDGRTEEDEYWRRENVRRRVESRLGSHLNIVNYEVNDEETNEDVEHEMNKAETEFKRDFIQVVYSGGNSNSDPYKGVVDTGAPKTVAGRIWMDAFSEDAGGLEIQRYTENEAFRFGNGPLYKSKEAHVIPVQIGNLKTRLRVSVVEANVPLLLGLDFQKEQGIVLDIGERSLYIKTSSETFDMRSKGNHWTLPIKKNRSLSKQATQLVLNVEMEEMDSSKLRKHIQRIHKNLYHRSEKQMIKLFLMAGKLGTRTRKLIKEIVENCQICRRFKKTPPRPKVAMAKAATINQVVALDLKEVRKEKKHILYCVDEFSGYIVAEVINNKEPETIFKAFDQRWVEQGPGIPKDGIFSDNGGEFKNPLMKEAAAQYGIKLYLTAANSPWSNGKNERNHYTVDRTIQKLRTENPAMKLEDAVSKAVYAHNLQINKTGFSPRQLMFGSQGVVPGITDGTPASMEPICESDEIRRQFAYRLEAEENYRKIDSNQRIKKALVQQIQGYNDYKYFEGDAVFFKEEGKDKWSGPAKVTGQEGSKVRIIHAGYSRTVPACRVLPVDQEKVIVEEMEESSNSSRGLEHQRRLEQRLNPSRGMEDQCLVEERPNSSEGLEGQCDDEGQEHSRKTETVGIESQEQKSKPSQGMEKEKVQFDDNLVIHEINSSMRPKRGQNIRYSVNGRKKVGQVVHIGKSGGKDRHRCWVKSGEKVENFDFIKDVQSWKVVEQCKPAQGLETKDKDHLGVFFLKHQNDIDEKLFEVENVNETYAINIPKKYHDHPDVKKAKQEELEKWKTYDAYEEVQETEDMNVISSRFVVTDKEDKVKARLCVRGFEEIHYPQSDSPTASNDAQKLFLAIAANEGFQVKTIDVSSAFLQGTPIDREVFMQPPSELKKEGLVWKLKKSVYGLYDASRRWWLAVKEELLNLGMKPVTGDEAVFMFHSEGRLMGLCCLHVDDFLLAGKPDFEHKLNKKLRGRFTISKAESGQFKYTGLNIRQTKFDITVDQIKYVKSIKPIEIQRVGDKDSPLTKVEFKKYRALTGQLSWAAENTRPDIAFDVRELATRNKAATLDDLRNANKVLRKAQNEEIKVKYSKLGNWKDLKLVTYTDSSYKNAEEGTKSVGGRVMFLANSKGQAVPLGWKSKTIQQVCKSVKSAETRSLDLGMEDSIFLSRMFAEICSGKSGSKHNVNQIPIEMKTDSRTLCDSIKSTKQVEEKSIRQIVAWIKQQKEEKIVKDISWVKSEKMIADVFTKKNVKTDVILAVTTLGDINI